MQHFEDDGGGPGLNQGELGVGVLPDDIPILEVQQIDDLGVQSKNDILFQVIEYLFIGRVYLVVHSHFELHALV